MGRLLSRVPTASISLFDRGDISSSRPDFPEDAARSGRQGRPKAVAQRLALDGREHSVKLPQSGDTGVSRSFRSFSTTATLPRGARHRARASRHELVFGRPRRPHHDAVMRIGGEAPRGGPILNRGAKAIVQRRVAAASVRRLQLGRRGDARTTATPSWLRRRAKLEPFRRFAGRGESPQHDEELAR